MTNINPAAFIGVALLVIVIGGLLYIFYSRTNAVEKTGAGSLIMLSVVALMIPVFWIMEAGNETSSQKQLFSYGVTQGQIVYITDCTNNCFGIVGSKVVNPTYNGYSLTELNAMTDYELTRVIDAGVYNPKVVQPTNTNTIPRSRHFGGGLSSTDVEYLFDFIRSTDPTYLKQNSYQVTNGFNSLPAYLQANNPSLYDAAVQLGSNGQFGTPVDDTSKKAVTIAIANPGNGVSCNSTVSCFSPINVEVKVGTTITWVNNSAVGHTVTAITGTNTASPTAAPQVFDSAKGSNSNLIPTGGKFTYTVARRQITWLTRITRCTTTVVFIPIW